MSAHLHWHLCLLCPYIIGLCSERIRYLPASFWSNLAGLGAIGGIFSDMYTYQPIALSPWHLSPGHQYCRCLDTSRLYRPNSRVSTSGLWLPFPSSSTKCVVVWLYAKDSRRSTSPQATSACSSQRGRSIRNQADARPSSLSYPASLEQLRLLPHLPFSLCHLNHLPGEARLERRRARSILYIALRRHTNGLQSELLPDRQI